MKAELAQPAISAAGPKVVPQRLKPGPKGATYGTAKAVPLTKTVESNGTATMASNGAGTLANRTDVALRDSIGGDPVVATPEQPTRVMEWVVVTEWQSADGARMVLTTATTENPAVKGQRVQSDVAPAPQEDSEQVHPYAAVPVVGGWLVFQL